MLRVSAPLRFRERRGSGHNKPRGRSMSNERFRVRHAATRSRRPLRWPRRRWHFPAIVRAQSDVIRIGHLTPRTGFLGQVGEYGFRGATLAVEEANAAGGVLGRKIELIAEDSVNPATAVTKAQKLIERDKVVCLIGEVSSASALAIARAGAAHTRSRTSTPAPTPTRCADRTATATCSTSRAATRCTPRPSGRGRRTHNLIKGATLVLPDRRLRLRPRPVPRVLALPAGERRHRAGQRHGADQHRRLQRLHPQDPLAQARLRLPQSGGRGPDHVPQAVQGVQPALPARRRRDGHRAVLGRRAGQPVGPLAEPVVPRPDDPGGAEPSRSSFSDKFGTPARQPGLGRLRGRAHRAADHRRDQGHRRAAARSSTWRKAPASTSSRSARAASATGTTSCCRKCTWSR